MRGAGTSNEAHAEVSEHRLGFGDAPIIGMTWSLGGHEGFFGRTPKTVPPGIAAGQVRVWETAGVPPEAS